MAFRWQGMFLLSLLTSSPVWAEPGHVVPVRSLAGITLGMSRKSVLRRLGEPAITCSVTGAGQAYRFDCWDSEHKVTAFSRQGKVVQIELRDALRPMTTFAQIRMQHRHLRVTTVIYKDDSAEGLYIDDANHGVAWLEYIDHPTMPESFPVSYLPKVKPDIVIVHRPGRIVLVIGDKVESSLSRSVRGWFAANSQWHKGK